jgi:hypothetical protein
MAKVLERNSCAYFDAAAPGTGPMGFVNAPAQSLDFTTYNTSFDFSIKSKSDYHLNPQPEANVFAGFPKAPQNRSGIYAPDTDRGELSATAYTQINVTGEKQFQNRLQDQVRPTTKETTLFAYDGVMAPAVTTAQSTYSQFLPQYSNINGKEVRVGGSSNYGLRTATEYSYIPGASSTGINGQAIKNPEMIGKNTKPVADFNVDGAGTFNGAVPDGGRFQQYRPLPQPTASGLRFNYNVETEGGSVADYSPLLGKQVDGIENRYTSSYQIAPLFTNPLHVIWDPDDKGEIPALFSADQPVDYAYTSMKDLPEDTFVSKDYNNVWDNDTSKRSTNAYILDLDEGIHNPRIEWNQGTNELSGIVFMPTTTNQYVPTTSYGGDTTVSQQYTRNQHIGYTNNTYTTFGSPLAGYLNKPVRA